MTLKVIVMSCSQCRLSDYGCATHRLDLFHVIENQVRKYGLAGDKYRCDGKKVDELIELSREIDSTYAHKAVFSHNEVVTLPGQSSSPSKHIPAFAEVSS